MYCIKSNLRNPVLQAEQRRLGSQPGPTFSRGQLTALHNDIRVLLRSQAGTFIFEYYQNTLLPAAADILLEDIEKVSSDLSASLATAWTHFYCHALPALEAVFVHVKVGFPSYKNFLAELIKSSVFLHRIYASVSQPLCDRGPVNSFFIRRGHGPNKFTRKCLSNFF